MADYLNGSSVAFVALQLISFSILRNTMVSCLVQSLAVFVAVCACTSCASAQDDTLTLAVFISINATFTGGTNIGRPFVEAVDLAVELINNDTDILPDYRLQYELSDAQVISGLGIGS